MPDAALEPTVLAVSVVGMLTARWSYEVVGEEGVDPLIMSAATAAIGGASTEIGRRSFLAVRRVLRGRVDAAPDVQAMLDSDEAYQADENQITALAHALHEAIQRDPRLRDELTPVVQQGAVTLRDNYGLNAPNSTFNGPISF